MTLNKFEGRDVVESTVQITKAGDGLSAALEVGAVTFKTATEGDGLVRVHKLVTSRATLVAPDSDLHGTTLAALNQMTETLAQAGVAKGSIPGQQTIDSEHGDEPARKDRPADEVPDDLSSLDAELNPTS